MVKKIIHTGDWHIRTMRMHREYKEIFKTFFSDVTDLVKGYEREEVRIVVAGDLVHNKTVISNEQLILATWVLSELEKIAPVIIIAGNHDLNLNNKDRMDSITPMVQFLPDANINYFKESKCYLDDNIVWCVYSIFEDNARPDIEGARIEFGDDKTYIGLFHGPLIGSSTDIGYEIEHGYGLDIFDSCNIVMCADIHKRQKITYKDIPVVFCSSLIQQNFGENITKHGFLYWDVESKSFTEHDVDNRFAYYQFRIKSLEDIESGNEQLTNL